ncbi:MAG: hypothetical protein IIA58_01605 [Candidatus Marinimicrobia bacterium]|nr:hypothetical protein [Candidatus Neomarinimicrobiota bacterium]
MGNKSIVRVGGVCAILAVVSGTMARIAFGNEWLKSRGVDTLITGHWFDVLGVLLFMVAALGFYRALRQAGPLPLIAVVASLTGGIFLFFHEFIRLGIAYELAPGIMDALSQTGWLAAGVGSVLVFFIGVLLFSFAILRTSVVPKWIGWLGLIAVAAQVALATSVLFESIRTPWFLTRVFLVWLVAMGVVLLRLKEPVAPDSTA